MKKGDDRAGSKKIFLLGLVSLLNDFSSEMITPILPMFITALGGAGIAVGLVGGIRDGVSNILTVIFGYFADKTGKRKKFVLGGYITSSIFKLMLSFSKIWQHVLIFSGLERVGKSMRTASIEAIIADAMPYNKGKGFGIHRTLDTAGAILGSLAVLILLWALDLSFRSIIIIASLVALSSIGLLLFIKEKDKNPQKDLTLKIGFKKLPSPLRKFIVISGVFALANFSYMFFVLKAQGAFESKMAIVIPILLYALFNIFYASFSIPFGVLSDKIGRKKVLMSGYLLFSLTTLGFALFNSIAAFVILFIMYGLVYAMVKGTERAIVSDLAPQNIEATALGTFHTVTGIIALPAGLIAGLLWQAAPAATFAYGTILSLTSAVMLSKFKNRINHYH